MLIFIPQAKCRKKRTYKPYNVFFIFLEKEWPEKKH